MSADNLNAAKDYWRTHHHQTARLPPRDEQPHRWALAEHIAALIPRPSTILEFGCSSGRNLAVIHLLDYLPFAHLTGIDMNPTTIDVAIQTHPFQFILGDENYLPRFRDREFDVVFTCSVLDHIPDPEWKPVYDELLRVARYHLVLLEPIVACDFSRWAESDFGDLGIAAVPFTYAHNYCGHDPQLHIVRQLPIPSEHWPEFGATYCLMQRTKDATE